MAFAEPPASMSGPSPPDGNGMPSRSWIPPFRNSSTQIRLLRLPEKLREDGGIDLELAVYDLTDGLSYRALSYTWDNPFDPSNAKLREDWQLFRAPFENAFKGPFVVKCNDQEVEVTRNLFEAFQHIIPRYAGTLLWNDALCIDQQNHGERNMQIQMMGDVYHSAFQVLVWLSRARPWDREAAILYEAFSATDFTIWTDYFENDRKIWLEQLSKASHRGISNVDSVLSNGIISLCSLLDSRSWITRKWTYQESTLAKEIVLLCGDYVFDMNVMHRILIILVYYQDLPTKLAVAAAIARNTIRILPQNHDLLSDVYTRDMMEMYHCQNSTMLVASLVQRTSLRGATEPRDRVLSVLGLAQRLAVRANQPMKLWPGINDSDTGTFFRSFTKQVLLDVPSLWPLMAAGHSPDRPEMPSWHLEFEKGPNYTIDYFGTTLPESDDTRVFKMVSGHGVTVTERECFGLTGTRITTIRTALPFLPKPGYFDNGFQKSHKQRPPLEVLLVFFDGLPTHYKDGSGVEQIARTLFPDAIQFYGIAVLLLHLSEWMAISLCLLLCQLSPDSPPSAIRDPRVQRFDSFQAVWGDDTTTRALNILHSFAHVSPQDLVHQLKSELEKRYTIDRAPGTFLLHLDNDWVASSFTNTFAEGDEVWHLKGGPTPFVLRPTDMPGHYLLLGPLLVNEFRQRDFVAERTGDGTWEQIWLL